MEESSGAVCKRVGRPGLPVPNSLCGFCGRGATLNLNERKGLMTSLWRT